MKKTLALMALMIASVGAQAQSSLGIELGTISALSFTQKLGKRFGYDLRTGFELSHPLQPSKGMILTANFEPKYSLSSQSVSDYYQSGAYFGINALASLPQVKLWGEKGSDEYMYTNEHLILGFIPTFGWVFPTSERSYVRASVGAGPVWRQYKTPEGRVYWWSDLARNSLTVSLQLTYSYRF